MTKPSTDLLALQFGGATVAQNLERAIESGQVIENDDGTLQVKPTASSGNWLIESHGPPLDCAFLMYFMFRQAYGQAAVPYGCRDCYKVKIVFRTLRELVAGWEVGRRIECRSKWGIDFSNPYSQCVYAGYFYVAGLDMARAIYKIVRESFEADARLSAGISMSIKRGCSEYEAMVGPSDRYEFSSEMAELEAYLRARFRSAARPDRGNLPLAHWIDVAFRLGDDTYLDFTGGKPLRAKAVTYDPTPG